LSEPRSCWYVVGGILSSVDTGSILMQSHPDRTRVEESANQFADVQKSIRRIIPPGITRWPTTSACDQRINMTYNTPAYRSAGGTSRSTEEGHRPTADYSRPAAVAADVSRHTFAFLPAISSARSQFAPAPITCRCLRT